MTEHGGLCQTWWEPKLFLFCFFYAQAHMCFDALTFAEARGRCLNPRPLGRGLKVLPSDLKNMH